MITDNGTPRVHRRMTKSLMIPAALSFILFGATGNPADAQTTKKPSARQAEAESTRPTGKRFEDLTKADFEKYPVWKVRPPEDSSDCIEPWPGKTPIKPQSGVYYVKAKFTLANGTKYDGVLSPRRKSDLTRSDVDVRTLSPFMWLNDGTRFYFWINLREPQQQMSAQEMREKLKKDPKDVFPVRCAAEPGLTKGKKSIKLKGVYYLDAKGVVEKSPY